MSVRLMRAESNEIPAFEEMPLSELQQEKTEIPKQDSNNEHNQHAKANE